ncbi:MAG TPA: tetratricopeptide repeat protein [Terriglobales bacterium]|nr:tetratricopeptide repeat protein [Terriglobales bacterium]
MRKISLLLSAWLAFSAAAASKSDLPKWIRVSSLHFAVLTDAEEKNGVEVALRLEQMRALCGQLLLKDKLTMPEPLDVVAFQSYGEYAQVAPAQGQQAAAQGFFLPGDDRNYIVLNLADEESWLAVRREFAKIYLNYNYPPTPPWFDEGFARFFSSTRVDDHFATIGGDPASLIQVLNSQPWQPLPDLFSLKAADVKSLKGTQQAQFAAESWIVMHYLLKKEKLPETGTYFGLVENQGQAVAQAIQQAYGMSAAQLEQSIKDYFHALSTSPPQPSREPKAPPLPQGAWQVPVAVGPGDVGTSWAEVRLSQAQALIAEVMARVPEHREEAIGQLNTLVDQPLTESFIAHRALGWAYFADGKFKDALEEFQHALDIDGADPWTHYYIARTKYEMAQRGGEMFPGLANMMQDLRIVLDWNTDFAEAYHMLAMARVQGGGINSALQAMRQAIRLNPRNESYLLDLARVYMAGKKWDDATDMLERLKNSPDQQIASIARQNLQDLPTLKKYGLMPQHATAANNATAPSPSATDSDDESATTHAEPPPDRRKVQFLKGRLIAVNCSQPPVAVLTVTSASRRLKLRTDDYKSLLLIGADEFSCDWRDRTVIANYKAGGKADGDLVSLEVQ